MVARQLRSVAVGATALSAVAALVTGAVGFVLAGSYKPHATGADMASLADSVQRSAEWSDRHSVASIVLLAASIGSLLVVLWLGRTRALLHPVRVTAARSEEHTSELQSLMRISYAVFCL